MNKTMFSLAAVVVMSVPHLAVAANPDCPNLEEVIIASKNHLDVGFTCTVPALMRRIRTSDAGGVLNLLDADRSKPEAQWIRWTLPAWSMDVMLGGTYAPERRARLEEAVRTRRLLFQAMPFTIEAEASDLEEMVRLLAYGSDISRRFGIDLPRHAKQTDVPEQGWALATVLANAGVKYLHIGINEGCKQNDDLANIPPLCWWEGPDGSRILLGYCSNYGEIRRGPFKPPKGWKHKTYLAYYTRGDNQGPISPKDAERVLNEVRTALPGVRARFGDPAEFADAIAAEEKENPRLPVIRGDMPDTWIHGQMTAPEETALHRHAQTELITLGVLDTTLRALGIETKPVSRLLDRGYRKSGLYSEHTWGLSCGRERKRFHDPDWRERYERGDFKYIDSAFEYHKDYARDAHRMAKDEIDERMKALAQAVDVEEPRVVVFNPLPYVRDAEVEVEMPDGGRLGEASLPGAVRDGGKVRFFAKGLPAGGYKTFNVVHGEQVKHVENQNDLHVLHGQQNKLCHFTVKFDLEKGGITSLIENATGRELVKQGGHALGQFLHERFSLNEVKRFVYSYNRGPQRKLTSDFGKGGMPDTNKITYAAMTPKKWTAKRVRTALGDVVTLTAGDTLGLAKGFEIRFSFPDHTACVDISWRVTDKTPDPTPEGGWICLPFNVAKPSFRVGRIGGTIDPAKDIIFFSNRNLMCVDRAITVRNGAMGSGVGVASADLPLWSLGKPGLWRYEPDYVPTEPEVFANLYNNQWNTNFPFWIPGSWTASLRVYPVAEGADEESAIFAPAWEIRQPCVAAFAGGRQKNVHVEQVERKKNLNDLHVLHGQKNNGRAGSPLPAVADGVAVSRKGVRVTAFCPNPDGAGTVLRVWEQAGKGGAITVTLPKDMKATSARPVNLRGEPTGEPIAIKDGKFSFDLGAWAPKSFILFGAAEEACGAAAAYEVKLDILPDRVKTPLRVDMERIGTLRPRSVDEIRGSNWTLGCETLDRDFAVFDEYKSFLAPLGIKTIRLQAGWAKCEKEKGKYDFAWLDKIIDYACAQGINVLLETGYGNPIYKGGGGWDLAGGFPTSDEGIAAWDAWVDAMTKHFKGRVRDWAMWNEPDIGGNKTLKQIVAFNIRTAKIIKRNIPDARIAGLSLAHNNPEYFEKCLEEMGGDVKMFDWFIYHGYAPAPESSYENVEKQKAVLAKYNPKAKLRQGENGCPSEMATKFALSGIPWSEYSQAKWDMRRMLGDLGHDVESSVFTICDFNHRGREINLKGLLRINWNKEVIAVKRAYYAVQNVVSIFDDTLERVKNSRFGTRDTTLSTYEYKKADGRRVLVFWTHADETKSLKPKYARPGDSFETRPAVFKYPGGQPFKEPVWIDLLTGRVYAFPKENQIVVPAGVVFIDVPVYDSPCVLTERSAVETIPFLHDALFVIVGKDHERI